MEFKVRYVLFVFVVFLICLERISAKKLIVVLIDGVRWDYIDDPKLKGIPRIIKSGVRAPFVVPTFPSMSYPNWYTLVTGLYAENHGFVGNSMYDNDTDSVFNMVPAAGSTDPHWWNDAEPIWATAEKNSHRSALYYWAGCEVEIRGQHPTICERQLYDGPPTEEMKTDFLERVEDVLEMFKPSKRIDRLSLALMFYTSVDYTGHYFGPNSAERKNALYEIDGILDKMQDKIKKAKLEDEVNIMVVSDHGMTEENKGNIKFINLAKYSSKIKHQLGSTTVAMIVPQPGMLDELFKEISADKIEGLKVYRKEDIPDSYHIKNSKKTSPLLLVAKKGYLIKMGENDTQSSSPRGHHGYDPDEMEDMRTVFLATGPDFQKGFKTNVLHNVDLYNVMCNVLHINPLPNNGSWDRGQSMLINKQSKPSYERKLLKSVASHHLVPSFLFIASLIILSSATRFKLL